MYVRVLVPVDASPAANRGLEEALRLAKLTGAHVRLLHVIDVMRHANGFETHAFGFDRNVEGEG